VQAVLLRRAPQQLVGEFLHSLRRTAQRLAGSFAERPCRRPGAVRYGAGTGTRASCPRRRWRSSPGASTAASVALDDITRTAEPRTAPLRAGASRPPSAVWLPASPTEVNFARVPLSVQFLQVAGGDIIETGVAQHIAQC